MGVDKEAVFTDPEEGVWLERPIRPAAGRQYRRFMIRTHLIQKGERLEETLLPYLLGRVKPGDVVVLSEKIVAIAEGRAVPLDAIRVRPLAHWLSGHVRQLGYGLGLRRPETMEMAIREAGLARILLAATVGALDRIVGRSGDFYRLAGRRVAAIDGPGPATIPPYNEYIVLAPVGATEFSCRLAKALHAGVAVVDVNDVGSEVLGCSPQVNRKVVQELMRDNPMGQGAERTPLGVLRRAGRVSKFQAAWLTTDDNRWIQARAGVGDSGTSPTG